MLILGLQGHPYSPCALSADLRAAWNQGWYHDSAAVLLSDGIVLAAIEEERLTRCKHTGKLPVRAARACLALAGCDPEAIDLIAFGEEGGIGPLRDPAIEPVRLGAILQKELPLRQDPSAKIRLVEHHISHAASTYVASGFEEALIFTADGFGDGVAGYVIEARGPRLDVLDAIAAEDSLGSLYRTPLPLLGFGAHDEFKMMGLAPYGDPAKYGELFSSSYCLSEEGRFQLDRGALRRGLALLGPPRTNDEPFSDRDSNVAAAVQAALERIVFHVLEHFRARTGLRALCAAGGVMQNSTLNGRIARSGLFDRVFVQPAANDCGLALGAAYTAHLREADRRSPPIAVPSDIYWGRPLPSNDDIEDLLVQWSEMVEFERCPDIVERAASLLERGAVLGWVQGRAEFGPRALGNRSILADPRPAANKDLINAMVKKRESFRPFAPAVRIEDADRYFELPFCADCSFMTFVVPVRKPYREVLGATSHVDGSARVQVVRRSANERFWGLLGAFGARTGTPVLLNTSFNNNHEPIVDSPEDALVCFLTTGLDALVIGDFLVRKRELTAARILALVPSLADDACLSTGRASDTAGENEPFHVLVTTACQASISTVAYDVLSHQRQDQTAAERLWGGLPDAARVSDEAIAAQLLVLWQQRVIRLRPSNRGLSARPDAGHHLRQPR